MRANIKNNDSNPLKNTQLHARPAPRPKNAASSSGPHAAENMKNNESNLVTIQGANRVHDAARVESRAAARRTPPREQGPRPRNEAQAPGFDNRPRSFDNTPMDGSPGADQFLVEQIKKGGEAAWRQLIDRYSGRLLAFARARTASLSDAEDLVQDTFVGFLQSLAHYDAARSLETYLFTILRYKIYDLLRQRKTNVLSEPASAEDWWDRVVPGTEETPSGLAIRDEAQSQQAQLLAEVLRQLIHEFRDREAFTDLQVIELIFFAGRRNLDIAELLELDQKAVAGVKFRAIGKLQKFLGEKGAAALDCLDEQQADVTVARVWREQRLTCLKRSTLGAHLLGVLEEPWKSYTQFHLDVVACPMCVANLADLEAEEDERSPADNERMFASSVGFLKRDAR